MSGDRPPPKQRRRREVKPGGFRVRSNAEERHHSVRVEVRWDEDASLDAIRKELTESIATAFAELDKRSR